MSVFVLHQFERVEDCITFDLPGYRVGHAAATQMSVQSSLQQWLGDLIVVSSVEVANRDSRLEVTVQYIVRRTQQAQTAQFTCTV